MYPGPLGGSIVGRAIRNGLVEIAAVDLRRYAGDRRGTVDDKPYGGGPGMLMKVEVLADAIADLRGDDTLVLLTSPRGVPFDQRAADELSRRRHLLVVCGHYEGVDQRAVDLFVDREYSIGDMVLTSGNLAAMVMIDAVVRLLPGALGSSKSSADESFATGLLEYPQYTRPPEFSGRTVPEVLLSGDHRRIEEWRRGESERLTRERRPDLWERYLQTVKKHGGSGDEHSGQNSQRAAQK